MVRITILISLALAACSTASTLKSIPLSSIDSKQLNYKVNKATIKNDSLIVNVQYGGGAIRPHEFELVEVPNDSLPNAVSVYLLHKTLNDRGRAILRSKLAYDIKSIGAKNKEVLLNGSKVDFEKSRLSLEFYFNKVYSNHS